MAGRILIADNVATNRIILKAKLASARYEVEQAGNVAQLLARARQAPPDIILTDLDLPGGAMAAISAGLAGDPALSGIPVIAISALRDHRARLAGLRAGADEVLARPLDETVLRALVRSLTRNHAAMAELRRKEMIARDFGFAESSRGFARRARIALIPERPEAGPVWRASLAGKCGSEIVLLDRARALDGGVRDQSAGRVPGALPAPDAPDAPDAFVISADLGGRGQGVQLVAELRALAATRQSVIVIHDAQAEGTLAATALDMGADTVLRGAFDAEELVLRLDRLIGRKLEAERLHAGLDRQLSFAMTDPLTGLYNRRYAQNYLERVRRHARLRRRPFTLMILDLDRFKRINDNHGHAVGDQVLIEVAARLRASLREMDLVARYGGEEFLIVLPDTGHRQAARTAERLRRAIGDKPFLEGGAGAPVPVTLSIGVMVAGGHGPAPDEIGQLISRADRALYTSKADGRNQITFVQAA